MAVETPVRLTVEEYLAWEESNFEKHEYIDGEVRCMAGANRKTQSASYDEHLRQPRGNSLEDANCYSSKQRYEGPKSR